MRMTRLERIITILLLSFQLNAWRINCYPHGAPGATCDSMTPEHDSYTPQQDTTFPYKITLSATTITSGDTLTVEIAASDTTYPMFEGFMIKAVYKNDLNSTVPGSFVNIEHGSTKYINCSGYFRSAITHDTADQKTDYKADWIAPYIDDTIVFLVSVVNSYETFWVKHVTDPVTISFSGTTPLPTTPIEWPLITDFDYSICGVSASCFGFPSQCIQSEECKMLVSYYLDDNNEFNFQLVAQTPGYVAFGLSQDQTMGDDSVVQCMMSESEVYTAASKNVPSDDNYMAKNSDECRTLISSSFSGTYLTCQFTRPLATNVTTETQGYIFTDLTVNKYYLMLALGWTNSTGNAITLHKEKMCSNTAVDLTSSTYIIVDEEIFNYDVCGDSQSCFGYPVGCVTQRNCQYMVSYFPNGDELEIQLSGKTDGYIAMGLSTDTSMGSDSVIQCYYDSNNAANASTSINIDTNNYNADPESSSSIDLISASYIGQILNCDLTIATATTETAEDVTVTTDLISNQYYLFLVSGPMKNDIELGKHEFRQSSNEKVNLMSNTFVIIDEGGSVPFDYNECGVTRSCFGYPSDCDKTESCTIIVSYFVTEDNLLEVDFLGTTSGYIAFALSTDDKMGDDSVLQCVITQELEAEAQASVNEDRQNHIVTNNGNEYFTPKASSYKDGGTITCNVTRPMVTTVATDTGYKVETDLDNNYFLLLAYGPLDSNGDLLKHTNHIQTADKVNLKTIQNLAPNTKPDIKIMVHGSLMVVAWIGTVSVAIFMARYYKDMWPDSMWCKVKIWFAVHRGLNVLTVVITIVAFILIFVYNKGFSDKSVWQKNPHPILGTITMVFAILQPFGSIFRCAPGTPKRPIFNWAHYIGGNTTCLIAVITIYFAVSLDAAHLPKSFYGILSGFLGFYVLMFIILECYTHMHQNKKKKLEKDIQKSEHSLEMDVKKPGSSLFKQIMLGVFICGIVGFVVALVTVICTAKI